MSKNDDNNKKDKRNIKNNFIKSFKIFLLVILIIIIVSGGVLATVTVSIIKDAPEIDPTTINASLSQTSTIYDSNEKLIEKIDSGEYRTFVSLDKMPKHLIDAFVSIEDERFEEHIGVDPKGIAVSLLENLQSGGIKRGASTITQQLVKNVYLSNEQTLDRKIKEAYLALQVEKVLHKDQIMESYLNRNFFGQNAAGVQEAAQTYFSKDVGELTLAESALFAGIVKSPIHYQPFLRVKPQDYDSESQIAIGEENILGEKYILVFNQESVNRQQIVLKKMLELGKIDQVQYDEALQEDIKSSLNPGQKKLTDITSYFSDYVKSQVVSSLITKLGYTEEEAEEALYKGGLQIYSTVDLELQKELEDVYDNFAEVILGNVDRYRSPVLIDWTLDSYGNIIDENSKTIYYKKSNILDEESNLVINKENFTLTDEGNIAIKDNRLTSYPNHIDITDYYVIDDRKNLLTYTLGSLDIGKENFQVGEDKEIILLKEFLDENKDFSNIDSNGNLIINERYFYSSDEGIVQPQSATVVLDYRTGEIQSIVGGRDVEGNRILNRATNSQRQPGSAIKPLSIYLPALDNGYTAGTAIDDIPFRKESGELWKEKGNLWPKNSYTGYKGMRTLRSAVEDSGNIPAVKTVRNIGINTSISYLEKLGIVNKKNGEEDNFVTAADDPNKNDENLSALGLGGMTNGLTPLEVTAAYGAIANNGIYKEPIAFTKILDKDGNLLLENTPEETTVVSPQIAYIMGDILRTNVANGIGRNAQLNNMVTAGKTGTTQNRADIWFVGYTPYYATGVWIGNDSPKITLNQDSMTAASFWKYIMDKAHEGLESKYAFDKPDGLVSASICTQSGKRPSKLCSQDPRGVVKTEIFAQGTVPTEYCDVHKSISVDLSTNKIANEYCPISLLGSRVYVQRSPAYKPWENGGILPRDYDYSAPTEICDVHGPDTVNLDDDDDEDDEDKDKNRTEDQKDKNKNDKDKNNGNGNNNTEEDANPEPDEEDND